MKQNMHQSTQRSLRIGIDARFAESQAGGISRYIQELTRYMLRHGDTPILITTRKLDYLGLAVENIILPNKVHWIVWEQIQLPFLIRKLNLDIYHAAGNWGVPLFYKKPIVLTLFDVVPKVTSGYFNASEFPRLSKVLYDLRIAQAIRFSDKVICISTHAAADIQKYYSLKSKKREIIPVGVSRSFFSTRLGSDKKLLNIYMIRDPYILNHGGIDTRKNLKNLIKAFALLKTKKERVNKDLKLVITGGDNHLRKELIKLAQALGVIEEIRFVGIVESNDLVILVRNAKVVVYPTLSEGFGMPLLEAMASEIPIVASNIPVLKEIGRYVPIYVNPRSVEDISSGIINSMSIKKERLEAGVGIAKSYTWSQTMKKTYKVYETVLNI